jgi:hypothetical protein
MLLDASAAAGWHAEDEVSGPDGAWRTDVLATRPRDGRLVAFEVQWSRQTLADYRRRQEAYERSAVRAAWFARDLRIARAELGPLPVFELFEEGGTGDLSVAIGTERVSLHDAGVGLLSARWRWRERAAAAAQSKTIIIEERCWSCGRQMIQWCVVRDSVLTAHGVERQFDRERTFRSASWLLERREAQPEVAAFAGQFSTPRAPLAILDTRSTLASGTSYLAFCCPHCRSVQGDDFFERRFSAYWTKPWIAQRWIASRASVTDGHWCEGSCP